MKPAVLSFLSIFVLIFLSCSKENSKTEFPYEAKVIGLNADCGLYQIKITSGVQEVKAIVGATPGDSVYIAKNLPAGFSKEGTDIKLNLRKPNDNELSVCTCQGPGYNWIYVTTARLK